MTALLLQLAPLLVLVYALLRGRHPGEQAIARLRCGLVRAIQGRRRRGAAAPRVRSAPLLPRGGRLVAAAIAARPPPTG
jgi:hypothetical protein